MSGSTTFLFRCGVARFDASGNLFLHLSHSVEAPAPATVAGLSVQAPADERRGQVAGGGAMRASGAFPGVPDLPRGYLLDLRGFDEAVFEDGTLRVTFSTVTASPPWLEAAGDCVFEHAAERLRLWVKSSLPEGVSLVEAAGDSKASAHTQAHRPPTPAAAAPATPAATEPPASADPSPAPKAEPYHPEGRPAGASKPDKKGGGLGCSTLILAGALLALAVAVL